jgi:hypothetical protein
MQTGQGKPAHGLTGKPARGETAHLPIAWEGNREMTNDHWTEWREAVKRTGYNFALAHAARALLELETLTPQAWESFTANLYREATK